MFSSAVQPALVSLFSSTSTDPLSLFSSHTDPALPADSFICLLHDTTSEPQPGPPAKLVLSPPLTDVDQDGAVDSQGYTLNQTVLHIQSPTLRTTYIRSPPAAVQKDLGMKHPWIHLQVRNMDKEWSLEIGIVDRSGRRGVVRCSTFQVLAFPSRLQYWYRSCSQRAYNPCYDEFAFSVFNQGFQKVTSAL